MASEESAKRQRTASDSAYDAHLSTCLRTSQGSAFRMPWETPEFRNSLLDFSVPLGRGPLPLIPVSSNISVPVPKQPAVSFAHRFSRVRHDISWENQTEKRLVAAVRKWTALVLRSPQSFDVGRKVTSLAPVGVQVSRSLRHVFAGKAVGTLHSRADPLIRYVAWADRHAVLAFPFKEDDMYEFACECEHTCSPSFLKSFLSAVTFCFFILGAESAQEAMASMRLSGVARACYLTKRKRVQRPPLSTEMVQRLERFVVSPDGDRIDRFIAGFFLLSIFMRARYSDTQNMYNVSEDKPQVDPSGLGGYLQADIARSKTSYTTERKTQLLPMVCPRKGIAGEDWFQAWSMLRKELNVPVGEGLPVLPAILTTGHWASHPPSASVAAGWLRNVLRKCGFSEAQCSPIGTHSCKATCLSWCARFGIDSYDQRVLGYHTAPGDRSAQVYSRDAVSASVRVLEKVLAAIRSGTFVPDSTRSGYFPTKDDPNASYDYEASSEASLDEEDAETDCQELERALDGVVDGWCEEVPKRELKAEHLVRNRSSRMLHLIADEGGTSLSCGRTCTKNYEKVAAVPSFLYPVCARCFNSVKTDASVEPAVGEQVRGDQS
ncbi:unnamed protein product [Symbiodinium sp. CCMP2592]|nr:unnamed protein product [Symbiodinium sp. CCMP2592]